MNPEPKLQKGTQVESAIPTDKRTNESIVRRYKSGESSIKLAEHYGVSPKAVIRRLRALKVKIRPRGRYASAE